MWALTSFEDKGGLALAGAGRDGYCGAGDIPCRRVFRVLGGG